MKRRIRLTEGDLRRIVNKSVRRALNEMNSPTISYQNHWDDDGTHYDQTIKIGLTQEDLDALNSRMTSMADRYEEPNEHGSIYPSHDLNGHEIYSDFLRTPLKYGENHLKLSQLYALSELLNWKEYKRVKMDRNTILFIVQI